MPKRKPFHNRLEELLVETCPDQPGPWEALLTRVEPEGDGWLVPAETPLSESNAPTVQPVPGAARAEARPEAPVPGLTVRPAADSPVAAARSPGARGKKKPARRAAPRSRAVLQAAPVAPELGPEENPSPRAARLGWKDFLAAIGQAEQVKTETRFIEAPSPRAGRPGWKDFLIAVRQAEQVEPEASVGKARSARPGTPGWKTVLQAVQQAEQVQPDFSVEEPQPACENAPGAAARPVLVTEKGPVLSAALLAGEEQLGSIELEGDPERPWSEQEAGLLNSVAQQMVLHLENLRLLEQAEQYRQEAEQVVRRMTRSGWEDYLLEKGPEGCGFVYDQGQVISLQPGDVPPARPSPAGRLAHPIKVRAETIGQLVIESPGENAASGLIEAVAERLGLQVESLRLLEETERARQQLDRRATELETVAQVSTAAAALLDPQALLQAVVDLTQSRLKLYHAQVYLLDEQAGWLIRAAGSGETGEAAAASKQALPLHANAAVAQAARERRGVIIPDVRLQAGYEHYPSLPNTLSELAVPMIAGEQVAGVFSVLADVPDRFYPDDLRTFMTLASQAAVALCNAELYAEQMETVERLRELDQLKSAFLANMSHELRTPLNSILGFAQVITEGLDGPLTEDMANDLHLIEKNGRHLLNLINDVLDMAKIEAGRLSLDFETFNLGELVQDVLETAGPLARSRSLDLRLDVDPMANLNLRADRFRIRQILLNLVGNAIKFTERGGVTVQATQQEEFVRLGIQDTGIGIPPEKLEAIFEAFSQVDTSTTRKAGGTGLGLPISRRLVEMHGGRLWAESRGVAGEGTLFWLELPIKGLQRDG